MSHTGSRSTNSDRWSANVRWGGVVGIRGSLPLLDGGTLNRPEFSRYDVEGKEWIMEGHGVDPDIVVDNDPAREFAGIDEQLNKAIELVKEELKKNPVKLRRHRRIRTNELSGMFLIFPELSRGAGHPRILLERVSVTCLPVNTLEQGAHQMFEGREERVRFNFPVHDRQKQLIRPFQYLRIDLATADHKHQFLIGQRAKGGIQRGIRFHTREWRSAQDNIAPAGKGFADGGIRLASHEHGVARGQLLEAFQVFGDMPGKPVVFADGAVAGDCRDNGELHTATSNLMAGWGSYPTSVKSSNVQCIERLLCDLQLRERPRGPRELFLQSVDMVDVDVGIDDRMAENAGQEGGFPRENPCQERVRRKVEGNADGDVAGALGQMAVQSAVRTLKANV